jgi:hypothetical protein
MGKRPLVEVDHPQDSGDDFQLKTFTFKKQVKFISTTGKHCLFHFCIFVGVRKRDRNKIALRLWGKLCHQFRTFKSHALLFCL